MTILVSHQVVPPTFYNKIAPMPTPPCILLSACLELITALRVGTERQPLELSMRVLATYLCFVFHQSDRVSAIQTRLQTCDQAYMLFYYRHIFILEFFHVPVSSCYCHAHVSVLRCVWE